MTRYGFSLSRTILAHTFATAFGLAAAAGTAHAGAPDLVWAEGTVQVQFEDGFNGSKVHHYLDTTRGRYTLTFAGKAPRSLARSGGRVRVTGRQTGAILALDGSGSVTSVSPSPLPNTLGDRKVAMLLVNFTDNSTQPYSRAEADAVLSQSSGFMHEGSSQQTLLSGNSYGWLNLPIAQTCDTTAISTYANQAATGAGIDLSGYQHVVYVFPRNAACMWSGQGTVGGTSNKIWINGRMELKTLTHELGHNFGLYHSHALECDSTVLGSACVTYDYGDTVDDMGNTNAAHFNAFQKERLGWLNSGTMPPITTVSASGSYAIQPYASGSGVKALKVLKSTDPVTGARTWYYLEFRQPTGFDAVLGTMTGSNVTSGLVVHTGADNDINSSFLLDLTPNSSSYGDWNDPALVLGQSYSDDVAGVTITPTAIGSSGATVYVTLASGSSGSSSGSTGSSGTVTSLTVAATTDKTSYRVGQSVLVSVKVSAGSTVTSGASVVFTIAGPDGASIMLSGKTDSKGVASSSYALSRKAVKGTYQVKVQASNTTLSGSATTSFSVK